MARNVVWKRLLNEDGILIYEGDTIFDKPYGNGKTYFLNGNVYQEGVFGIKGLLKGKEYYPSGVVRFEGEYTICKGYGPNYPVTGQCYDENGNMYYEGRIHCTISGLGYPRVEIPNQYGPVSQEKRPSVNYFMWEDDRKMMTED